MQERRAHPRFSQETKAALNGLSQDGHPLSVEGVAVHVLEVVAQLGDVVVDVHLHEGVGVGRRHPGPDPGSFCLVGLWSR